MGQVKSADEQNRALPSVPTSPKAPVIKEDRYKDDPIGVPPLPKGVPGISIDSFDRLRKRRYNPMEDDGETPVVTIGFESDGTVQPLANKGNSILIYGLYGTRKSTLQRSLKAAILSPNGKYGNWVIPTRSNTGIVAFDTEQPDVNWRTGERELFALLNETQDIPRYNSIPLAHESDLATKLSFVLEYIYRCNAGEGSLHNDIGYVFIDQIGDLLADGNDESECKSLWNCIVSILDVRGITLIATLHTEKTGRSTRGSAGSISEQKVATTIKLSIENDGEPTKLEFKKTRLCSYIRPIYFAQGRGAGVDFSDNIDSAKSRMNTAIRDKKNAMRHGAPAPDTFRDIAPGGVYGQPSLESYADPKIKPPPPSMYPPNAPVSNLSKKDDDPPF